MALKSHTLEEIRAAVTADPTLKIYDLDTGTAGEDDVLLGHSADDVIFDLACHFGWGGVDPGWALDLPTGFPVGWSLRETALEELE